VQEVGQQLGDWLSRQRGAEKDAAPPADTKEGD
jgi:hypothetical protein